MSLKRELQNIDPAAAERAVSAYHSKMVSMSVSRSEEYESESLKEENDYQGLTEIIASTLFYSSESAELTRDQRLLILYGARSVVGTLIEIAETEDMQERFPDLPSS